MKYFWPLLILFVFWFGMLMLTGTMTSGFHFTDDHDVIRIDKDLDGTTLERELGIFEADLLRSRLRFRPFYQLHRRIGTAVLGTNFTVWSIYFGILAVFTFFFLALFMNKSGFSISESVFFALLTLLGEQAAIWWKLGANETLGMFLLSAALLCMVKSIEADSDLKVYLYTSLYVLLMVLASWSKESFILMIPAVVFWRIVLTYRSQMDKEPWEAVKANIVTSLLLLTVFVVELVHIFQSIGTTGIQYAGYEGFNPTRFLGVLYDSMMAVNFWIIVFLAILIAITLYLHRRDGGSTADLPKLSSLWWVVVLAGLITGPQLLLYMKSGITERYLLPGVMGYILIVVALLRYLRLLMPPQKKIMAIAMILLALVCVQHLRITRYTAIAFAKEGKETNQWLQSIETSTGERDKILVITHMVRHLEPSVSLKTYLKLTMNRKSTAFSPHKLKLKKDGMWNQLNKDFVAANPLPGAHFENVRGRLDAVLLFPGLEEVFLKENHHWFKAASFVRYTNDGGFVSYYKR